MKTVWLVFVLILLFAGYAVAESSTDGGGDADSVSAYPLIEKLIKVFRKRNGKELSAEDTVGALNSTTVQYIEEGKYAEAEPIARQALAFGQARLGLEHPQTLYSLNNLAMLYLEQGRHGEAEPLLKRAMETRERAMGREHPDTLVSLNNLALLYLHQGRYEEAEPLYLRTLETSERVLGPDHPNTLVNLGNLAGLYFNQGRYGETESLLQRALEIQERILGREHPHTLTSLNNLVSLYQEQGRYGEVEPLLKRALETRKRVLGAEHPHTLYSLNNLAMLYRDQGRYGEAEPLLKRALEGRERVLGREHPDTLQSLNNLAALYHDQGRHGEAETLYRRTLAAYEQVLGLEHPDTLGSLNNLAMLYRDQGRPGEAEPLLRRASAAYERVLGKIHPNTLNTQLNLALLEIDMGNIKDALVGLREMDGRLRQFVDAQLDTTRTEKARRSWLSSKLNFQSAVYTLALQHPGVETRRLAADVLLGWQHLAGEGEALDARLARESDDPRVRKVAGDLAASRARLSHLMNSPKPDSAVIAKEIAEELERLGELEVQLAGFSREYQGHLDARQIGWQAVRERLPAGSALLALRTFLPIDLKTSKLAGPRWLGVLIPAEPSVGQAIWIADLKSTSEIITALTRLRVAQSKIAARTFYAALFEQWDKELAQYDHLYLVPDGSLELTPFDRLILPDGRYWVERQTLHRLRAGRDLVTNTVDAPSTPATPTGLLALGGIDYGKLPTGGSLHSTPATQMAMNQRLRAERGAFSDLPATGREIEAIARQYRENTGQPAKTWHREKAGEGRLKKLLSPSATPPRVLHLATHGFFLEKRSAEGAPMTERPMTLGGLALAGANRGMGGETDPAGEDGVLYALEAQSLNLQGTELVVLSACDTGQGEIDYSDGLYGLTRAFRIAGARNVLMTLWPLDDQLAAEFMVDFYGNWLSGDGANRGDANNRRDTESRGDAMNRVSTGRARSVTPAEALRQTRLAWINSDDERRRDPRFWAPYVLVE